MKIELLKVNEANGTYWYGIRIDGWFQTPSYGTDLEKAQKDYEEILEVQKNPAPKYETIRETVIEKEK